MLFGQGEGEMKFNWGWVEWFFFSFFFFGLLIMNNWGLLLIEITSENFFARWFFLEYDNWNILFRAEVNFVHANREFIKCNWKYFENVHRWVLNFSLIMQDILPNLPCSTHQPSQFPEILINYTIYRIMHASQLTRAL